jgi:hypothetical protein
MEIDGPSCVRTVLQITRSALDGDDDLEPSEQLARTPPITSPRDHLPEETPHNFEA